MTENYKTILSFRRRFVKDYNLPINVVDSPYFEYYMETYDWFPKKEYNELINDINKRFDGNINKWLEEYGEIRDKIITTIENSEAYQEFNLMDMKIWDIPKELKNYPDINIYNQSSIGNTFISFDLKKANFQALKYVNPEIIFENDTYEEMIDDFVGYGSEYLKTSKYTRQVIFGKLNPKRTITIEKYVMSKVYEVIKPYFRENEVEFIAFKADELIFKVKDFNYSGKDIDIFFKAIKEKVLEKVGVEIHTEIFKIGRIVCENHNNITVDCYIKQNLINGEEKLKSASQIFYPQLYSYWRDKEITENDLVFLAEGQLAKFMYPLQLIKIEK